MQPITQKTFKGINTKLGILAAVLKLQEKGHNSESYIVGVMPLFNFNFEIE